MQFEVYSGAKPGRPRLLPIVTAGLLAGALGLAWWQAHTRHALGPEQAVGDTPLRVQPPRGWVRDPGDPRAFILPSARRARRDQRAFERRIQFEYTRLPTFQTVVQLLAADVLGSQGTVAQAERVRLGPYPAVQVHQIVPVLIGRTRLRGEMITRFTCLPRGQVIKVQYEPLVDLRPADVEMLDDVCRTLRIDDPTLSRPAEEFLATAGLKLPLERGWQVVGTDFPEVRGVFISGAAEQGPAWSVAVLRTWLVPERTPADLLGDLAARCWSRWDTAGRLREEPHAAGGQVTALRHPDLGASDVLVPSARIVRISPTRVAMLLVFTDAANAVEADRAAERMAAALQIDDDGPVALETARAAGAQLVADLRQAGPTARWGREAREAVYQRLNSNEVVIVQRAASQGRPERGYEGGLWRRVGQLREERVTWNVDGRAGAYRWQGDFFIAQEPVQVVEQRAQPTGPVTRQILTSDGARHRWSFTPGDTFVPPPVESIINGWVARSQAPFVLVETSVTLGPGTCSVLLQPLPPDGAFRRVLLQEDYWPLGLIQAYDDAHAELEYELAPGKEYRRRR